MIKYIVNKLNLFLISIVFSSELLSLEILEVKMMDSYKITREFPGKLLPAEQSNLAFEIPGKINVINVDIGDAVKKGQILAELDNREATAQLKQAKAKYDLALQILNRYKDLRSEGHISIQDLDNANSEELIAKSQYEFYKVKLEQTKLIAPFDGVIQNRYLDTGSVINGGIPIVEILGSKNVEAHISIPLKFIDKLNIDIITESGIFYTIKNETIIKNLKRKYISIFSNDANNQISTFGLKYELKNNKLPELNSGTLNYAIKNAHTRQEQEDVCEALKFKTDVLWVMQDALYHSYINGHVPPGAFKPEDFNDRYTED